MSKQRPGHVERVHWLLQHQRLWEGFSQSKLDIWDNPEAGKKWKEIVKQMKAAGVVAKTTYYADVNLAGLIGEARLSKKETEGDMKKRIIVTGRDCDRFPWDHICGCPLYERMTNAGFPVKEIHEGHWLDTLGQKHKFPKSFGRKEYADVLVKRKPFSIMVSSDDP